MSAANEGEVRYVTTGRAARILEISHDTVSRMCEEGTLEAIRDPRNGYWRIAFDSILRQREQLINPR